MKKVFVLIAILSFGAQLAVAQQRETVAADWNNDLTSKVVYDTVLSSITQNLRRYNFYYVDFATKNNPADGWWRNEVWYTTYQNPNYYEIRLNFNYFSIMYYFSNTQLNMGGIPFSRITSTRALAQDANEVVDRIFLQMMNILNQGPSGMSEQAQGRLGVDLGWLIGTRGNLKMQVN